jgi:manganese transport protein
LSDEELEDDVIETREKNSTLRSLLKTWGPAWLVMMSGVDAASVIAASENGALYGTKLIWLLIILIVPLFVIQEVAGRTGIVTGRGLGELAKEKFGRRNAVIVSLPMAVANVLCYSLEYVGIALGFAMFGITPLVSIPLVFAANLVLVWKRKYATIEKVLIAISVVLILSYGISVYLRVVKGAGIEFTPFYFSSSPIFLFLVAVNIGSTIAPYMLFFQPSASAEKGIGPKNLRGMRLETLIGAIVSELIVIAIGIASTGINSGSIGLASPNTLSNALSNVVGSFAPYLFGLGLISSSFLALIVISLGSTWGVSEALGQSRKNSFRIYMVESVAGVIISLLPFALVNMALNLLALDVVILIGPGLVLGLVASDRRLMGKYSLHGWNWWIYWIVLFLMIGAGIASLAGI